MGQDRRNHETTGPRTILRLHLPGHGFRRPGSGCVGDKTLYRAGNGGMRRAVICQELWAVRTEDGMFAHGDREHGRGATDLVPIDPSSTMRNL